MRPEIYETLSEVEKAKVDAKREAKSKRRGARPADNRRGPYKRPVVEGEDGGEANAGAQSEAQRSDSADARAETADESDT